MLLHGLRPSLEPMRIARGLAWEDARPMLELVEPLDEVRAAPGDPDAFLQRVSGAGGPAGRRLVLGRLRPRLESLLLLRGVPWEAGRGIRLAYRRWARGCGLS